MEVKKQKTPYFPTGNKKNTGEKSINLFLKVLFSLSIAASFVFPVSASAGIISRIQNLFYGTTVLAEEPAQEKNSQNLPLLKAQILDTKENGGEAEETPITPTGVTPLISGPMRDSTVEKAPPTDDTIYAYVVRKGDTVSGIAKMYNVTPNTIFWANDMSRGEALREGQTLVILPISGVRYVVKDSKDTLKSIAKKYKADVDEVARFNGITEDSKLAVGDTIIIPDGEMGSDNVSRPANRGTGLLPARFAGLPSFPGYYTRPVSGGVKSQGVHGHNGVDIASFYGAPILAAATGDVLVAHVGGWGGGYGNYIVIQHSNGTQTLYGHLSRVNISAGDHVNQGQIIGAMGSTGKSTGVHLHFEVRGAKNPF